MSTLHLSTVLFLKTNQQPKMSCSASQINNFIVFDLLICTQFLSLNYFKKLINVVNGVSRSHKIANILFHLTQ